MAIDRLLKPSTLALFFKSFHGESNGAYIVSFVCRITCRKKTEHTCSAFVDTNWLCVMIPQQPSANGSAFSATCNISSSSFFAGDQPWPAIWRCWCQRYGQLPREKIIWGIQPLEVRDGETNTGVNSVGWLSSWVYSIQSLKHFCIQPMTTQSLKHQVLPVWHITLACV